MSRRAFTLIETLVTVTVIAALLATLWTIAAIL